MTTRKLTVLGRGGVTQTPPTTTSPKSWSDIVKTNVSSKNVPKTIPKSPTKKTKPVEINLKVQIPVNVLDKAYPDLLISLMKFLPEENYLIFTSAKESLEDLSLQNTAFLAFLEHYRPIEYQRVLKNKKVYIKKLRLNPNDSFLYYTIHRELYPDYYDDDGDDPYYGMSEKEIREAKKEEQEEDILEEGRTTGREIEQPRDFPRWGEEEIENPTEIRELVDPRAVWDWD